MFRPLETRTVRWRPIEGEGLEHVTVLRRGEAIVATGVVIGARDGASYGARYEIGCDAAWRVRRLDLTFTDGRAMNLVSDGHGHWRDGDGHPLSAFDGCIDIDLSGSPFTNTLPIRRLDLAPEEGTVALEMVYIPFQSLAPIRDGQLYRCLEPDRRFRYEAADGSFSAEILVDRDGLVERYPPLFERVDDGERAS
jgi:hypothetical protein